MKTKDKNIQIKPSKKKGEKRVSIILENELTIFSIEKMKESILDAINKHDIIDFELKNISNMDLAFVQLFFSIKSSSESLNKKISINADLTDDINSLFNNSDLTKVLK